MTAIVMASDRSRTVSQGSAGANSRFQGYTSSMTLHSEIPLARLREIGWKLWDPIGLANGDGLPDEGCADEYDRYLLHVVSMIRGGGSVDEATIYLTGIASEYMGLGGSDTQAAATTSQAIADCILNEMND